MERQEDQGEYAQEGQQRVSWNKVHRVRKKVKGLLCKDGLLYHSEAETISAVATPTKVSASRCVGKIEAQSQRMLQLRRETLAHPITQEDGREALLNVHGGCNSQMPHAEKDVVYLVTSDCGKMTSCMACHTLSYTGNFYTPGRHFTNSLPTGYFLGQVVSLNADAHPLARGNLRPISVDLLQPHPH
ncbi:hypothetical protein O181_125850 [Austropuccinia psidii MF-1]|uniref:Uncharacterized protein n=1 Tax=Austropuccinia psidii MF-1 TaxID=1389203 RepID=A0A9Q3KVM1_9BASI|nr:hypothetical protein [Austropuccinia psidii MF-1]